MSDNTPTEEQKRRIDEAITEIIGRYDFDNNEFLLLAESLLGLAVTAFDHPIYPYFHAIESLNLVMRGEWELGGQPHVA